MNEYMTQRQYHWTDLSLSLRWKRIPEEFWTSVLKWISGNDERLNIDANSPPYLLRLCEKWSIRGLGDNETLELGCMDFLQIRSPGFLHAHIHPRRLIFDLHFRYHFLIIKPLKLTMGQKCGRDTIFYSQNHPIFQLGTQLMYIFQPRCIYFRVM